MKMTAAALALIIAMNSREVVNKSIEKIKENNEISITEHGNVFVNKESLNVLAKLVWGEARGVKSKDERAAVIWCVLNRVDAGKFGDSIIDVATAKYQFTGYRKSNPVTEECYELALDVVTRWELEKRGVKNVGRTLPKEYLFFVGYDGRNWFRKTYKDPDPRWDWSLPSPY